MYYGHDLIIIVIDNNNSYKNLTIMNAGAKAIQQ